MSDNWRNRVSDVEAAKRAGGRRSYNAKRRYLMWYRRLLVAQMVLEWVGETCRPLRGVRSYIARKVHKSRQTISRDFKAIFGAQARCAKCGTWVGKEELEEEE